MIVRDIEKLDSARVVKADTWQSKRLILEQDNMGFSFNITTMYAGTKTEMCYKNHLESCYCLAGKGQIENLETGEVHLLYPGVIYILDKKDRHIISPETDIEIACVFNPALRGDEVHRPDGSYAAP